jgi:glycosyltransferase involved in cell wall biosynthesis
MTHFTIIVPVYNAEQYILDCLQSISNQEYGDFSVYVIDDKSSDKTSEVISSFSDGRFQKIFNKNRVGALANIVSAIDLSKDNRDDVIVTVDGDDVLANKKVLSHLHKVYVENNCWMTYGQFVPKSGKYPAHCKKIPLISEYRQSGEWFASHLRTFKRELWSNLQHSDLRDESGGFFQTAWDAAFMFPLLEMSGDERAFFIKEVMYIYNDTNPISDMTIHEESQLRNAAYIRSLNPYQQLSSL